MKGVKCPNCGRKLKTKNRIEIESGFLRPRFCEGEGCDFKTQTVELTVEAFGELAMNEIAKRLSETEIGINPSSRFISGKSFGFRLLSLLRHGQHGKRNRNSNHAPHRTETSE